MCDIVGRNAQKKSIELRRLVRELADQGCPPATIAKRLGVNRMFVWRWLRSPDVDDDRRGWRRGTGRRWDAATMDRVLETAAQLRGDPAEFFFGSTVVARRYHQRYPEAALPPVRTIARWLSAAGLTRPHRRRVPGAARHLCYPERTLASLGARFFELDAIGPRFLHGARSPLHFLGYSCKYPPRVRHYERIPDQTAATWIRTSQQMFDTVEWPNVVKVANAPATVGSNSAPRTVSRYVQFLLHHDIVPVFAVPRRPFSQASIEGNNSIFARHFWRPRTFTSPRDVDEQLTWFNAASQRYARYQTPTRTARVTEPRVYYVRQVRPSDRYRDGYIEVANTVVHLPAAYVNLFVLADWDLARATLSVWLEHDDRTECIHQMPFAMHRTSQQKVGRGV